MLSRYLRPHDLLYNICPLPLLGSGLTGLVLQYGDHVLKVPKLYALGGLVGKERENLEYINDCNRATLVNEKAIFERLGNYKGIIKCFDMADDWIELSWAENGDLKNYIETKPEPSELFKVDWICAAVDDLCYVHSRRIFADDIALRNFLVDGNESLKLTDFGQAILLPWTADLDTICEKNVTAKIEILHLGWIIYSISVWEVHEYYFFDDDQPHWPQPRELLAVDHLSCGEIIRGCWRGEYVSMEALKETSDALLKYVRS